MFAVKGKYLWWDDELLGNASALYLDPHEANYLTEKDGVVHKTLPNRVDGLMVDDSGDVVVIESKKPDADKDGVPDWADKKHGKDDNTGKDLEHN